MILGGELLNLVLYCVQQVGIALGLGSQAIMLIAYLMATRDGVVDSTEAKFLRATRWVLAVSLALILVSGVCITVMHIMSQDLATVLAPAFLLKWLLIVIVISATLLLHVLPESFAQGILGGTWSALFVVHILAPVSSWVNLLTLYGIWLVGFMLIWYVLVFATREPKIKSAPPKAAPVVVQKPQPQPVVEKTHRFWFFEKKNKTEESKPTPEAVVKEVSPPAPTMPAPVATPAPVAAPEPMPRPAITLDPAPKYLPIVLPTRETNTPQVVIPIKPAATGTFQPPVSEVKSPAAIRTDTPFLPQVPPLEPIPVMPAAAPVSQPVTPAVTSIAPPAPDPSQKPETTLGLNVMPKSPDQLK